MADLSEAELKGRSRGLNPGGPPGRATAKQTRVSKHAAQLASERGSVPDRAGYGHLRGNPWAQKLVLGRSGSCVLERSARPSSPEFERQSDPLARDRSGSDKLKVGRTPAQPFGALEAMRVLNLRSVGRCGPPIRLPSPPPPGWRCHRATRGPYTVRTELSAQLAHEEPC